MFFGVQEASCMTNGSLIRGDERLGPQRRCLSIVPLACACMQLRNIRPDLPSRRWPHPGAQQMRIVARFLNSLIKTSGLWCPFLSPAFGMFLTHCLSFYLFISNPAPLPLPSSFLHSLNFVLWLCALCCHTQFNCFSIFCFPLPLFWLIVHQFPSLSYFSCSYLLKIYIFKNIFFNLCSTFPFNFSSSPSPLFFLSYQCSPQS